MKRVCLVGCGRIGALHAKNLSGRAELFFCSRTRASAERFNGAFGGMGVFEGLDAVLACEDVDAVVIASPPEHHRAQIVRSLDVGKAVLVEKPMCVSQAEVDAVGTALAEHPAGLLMVAENYYYKPSLEKLKALIGGGAVGEVRSVAVKKLTAQAPSGWRRRYGALLEGGIHFVALVSGLLEAAPLKVTAGFPGRREGEPERHSVVEMEYPGGIRAELRYAWDTPSLTKGTFQHSHILGTKGRIAFESNGIYVFLRAGAKTRLFFPGVRDLMGYGAMAQDFLDCLADRSRRPYSDFEKARRDLGVVFEAYRDL